MRIDLAYCVELNRIVDIYTACLEFSAQTTHKKFHFYCSDKNCRGSKSENGGVRVSGVNHQFLPSDEDIQKSPHYRLLDSHSTDCPWVSIDKAINELKIELGEDSAFVQLNKKNRKLISRFILPNQNGDDDSIEEKDLTEIRTIKDEDRKINAIKQYIRTTGTTATCLESLVSCFQQLLEINKLDEELLIPGHTKTTYKQFFKQLKYSTNTQLSVTHGGAKLYKRYKKGFSLNFIDKYDGLPVALYISDEAINSSKYGKHLARIADELEKNASQRPYAKIYWIGGLINKDKFYSANINSLSHIVMRIIYPQQHE